MENLKIELNYKNLSFEELGNEEMILCKAAQKAALNAYAAYSNFKVGAAVLLENGEIICGNNQENASFPSPAIAKASLPNSSTSACKSWHGPSSSNMAPASLSIKA